MTPSPHFPPTSSTSFPVKIKPPVFLRFRKSKVATDLVSILILYHGLRLRYKKTTPNTQNAEDVSPPDWDALSLTRDFTDTPPTQIW